MQTINQLNETNKILQNNIALKDATITALKQAFNDRSNVTTVEPSLIIVVPSSDELDKNYGKAITFKQDSYYFTLKVSFSNIIFSVSS